MSTLEQLGVGFRTRTPVILQSEAAECGVACLAMLAGHHGHRIDLPSMRRRYAISLKGTTLYDLVRIAAGLGMATRAIRLDMKHLSRLRLPAMLHWDHNHFVVLAEVKARSAIIHDPAIGRRTIPFEEMSKHFTGVALEAWPTQQFQRKTERERVRITDLLRRTSGIGGVLTQVLLMSVLLEITTIAMPIGFQFVLDNVLVANDRNLLLLIALGLGLVLLFRTLTEFVRSWALIAAGSSLVLQWKTSLQDHLLRLPLSFFERRHVGDVVSRFGSIDAVEKTLSTGAVSALMDGAMSLVLFAMMWLYSPWLGLIALLTTLLYAALRIVAYLTYRRANEEQIVYEAQEQTHFMETVRGMASVKALGLGERRMAAWTNRLVDRVNAEVRVQKLDLIYSTANLILFGLDRILIIYFGATEVMAGGLTIGMLVAFLSYKDQFSGRVGRFLDTAAHVTMLSVHGERIADIALAPPETDASAAVMDGPLRMAVEDGALSARDIHFRYGENEPEVLDGCDIDVAPGECVAIAGPSGAGKTTLLKILAGLLRPGSGTVYIDGTPLSLVGTEAYRRIVGCVLQDDRLFAGSIADNIAGFAPDAEMAAIEEAARLAAIHDEIMRMPMSYETLVGDMGSTLSGGQMQRIVLARALYRRPRILLLDEATSHLDEDNELRINQAIRRLTITRVIVAHRRSTLEMADRIVTISPAGAAEVLNVPAAIAHKKIAGRKPGHVS